MKIIRRFSTIPIKNMTTKQASYISTLFGINNLKHLLPEKPQNGADMRWPLFQSYIERNCDNEDAQYIINILEGYDDNQNEAPIKLWLKEIKYA